MESKPETARVVAKVRPFVEEHFTFPAAPGATFREIVAAAYPAAPLRNIARAWVDGREVPVEVWETAKPAPGALVSLSLVPAGVDGGFGSNTLRNVLSVALVLAGAGLSNLIGGPLGWIIGTAVSLLGPWVVGRLIPPQAVAIGELGYAISGIRNTARPWESIPKVYGRNKNVPPLGANWYTETLGSDLYFRALFVLGYGPLQVERMRIGDQDILDEDGHPTFEGLEVEVREGYEDDPPITLVTQDVDEDEIGDELIYTPEDPIIHTTAPDADEISVDIEFPNGLVNDVDGDLNGWSVFFRIRYRPTGFGDDAWIELDEGVASLVSDLSAILTVAGRVEYLTAVQDTIAEQVAILEGIDIGDRVLTEEVQTTLLQDLQVWINALNTMNDEGDATLADEIAATLDAVNILDDMIATFTTGTDMLADVIGATDIIKQVVDFLVELERVNNYIAQGYGPALETFPWWAQLLIRRRGAAQLFGEADPEAIRITAAEKKVVRRGFRWKVTRGQYDVWVERVSAPVDAEDLPGVQEQAFWTKLRTFHYREPVNYNLLPPLALVAIRVKATDQLTGVLNEFSSITTARVMVATPSGDTYTWARQASRNPAWAFVDCLTGPQNIRPVSLDRINVDDIYAWAQACEEEVFKVDGEDDRTGRTFDVIVSRATTVEKMARTIAAAGRAALTLRDGLYTVVRDVPQTTPIQVFGPSTSWGFTGERVHQAPPDALRVFYVDEAADYQQAERLVLNDGVTEETAATFERLELAGVTDARQAWVDGRYQLAVAKLRPRRFSFSTMLDWIVCSRGDLIRVRHDVPLWGLADGRISNISVDAGVTTLRLDTAVPMDNASHYAILVAYSDGFTHEVNVDDVAEDGEYFTVSFVGTLPASTASRYSAGGVNAAAGDRFLFGTVGNITQDLIVVEIQPGRDKEGQIVCVDAAPGVHWDPNDPIPVFDPNVDIPPILERPRPNAPVIALYPADHANGGEEQIISDESVLIRMPDGSLEARLVVYLEAPALRPGVPAPARLQVQYFRIEDGTDDPVNVYQWVPLPDLLVDAREVSIRPVEEGRHYAVRLRYVSEEGLTSNWTTIPDHLVIGKTAPPPDVVSVFLDLGNIMRWTYPPPPLDFKGFIVKWLPFTATIDNDAWNLGILISFTTAQTMSIAGYTAGERTFLVKGVDMQGNESANPAGLIVNFNGITPDNVVVEDRFDPTWDQSNIDLITEGAEVLAGKLYVPYAADDFFWTGADGDLFWTGSDSDPFWNYRWGDLLVIWHFTAPPGSTGSQLTVECNAVGAPREVFYRRGPIPPENGGIFEVFETFPGALSAVEGEEYYFLVIVFGSVLEAGAARPYIETHATILDVPDIVERFQDVEITAPDAATGIRLPIERTYNQILGVSGLVIQDTGTGAMALEVVDKGDPSPVNPTGGPLVRAKDETGAYVACIFDAEVFGF